ncbi:holin family protein [Paroceanicella profunda]|uniref:holin family protein n=1 Tax=Paroceanicella profunda TaxID=2579971 RepID=UPI00197F2544|nr:holin family protein [Paroceanicella profunda]
MGMMSWLFGGGIRQIASGVKDVSEVFRVNSEAEAARQSGEFTGALEQFGAEFRAQPQGRFAGLVDGLNRLPRPALALGCLALFVYAMADPLGFSVRMQGLQLIPEPLWWLLGAVVSFYFGARELHYLRENRRVSAAPADVARTLAEVDRLRALAPRPIEEPAFTPERTPAPRPEPKAPDTPIRVSPLAEPHMAAQEATPEPPAAAPEPAASAPVTAEVAATNPPLAEYLARTA